MNPAKNQTNEKAINSREREGRVMEMRRLGLSYRQIGSQLHISAEAAWKIVKRCIARLNEKTAESAEMVRAIELERLDKMWEQMWPLASSAATETITDSRGAEHEVFSTSCLESQKQCLRIMERRALLLGLDAPKKIEIEDVTDIDSELEELLARRVAQKSKSGGQISPTVEIECTTEPVDPPRQLVKFTDMCGARLGKDSNGS